MTGLIDENDLIELLAGMQAVCHTHAELVGISKVWQQVKNMPTVDAVPKEKILLFLNTANEELSKAHADKDVTGILTWNASVLTLESLLKEYDTADTDIVPVIRCRDCKNYSGEGMYCSWNMIASAEGFCFHANEKPEYADD